MSEENVEVVRRVYEAINEGARPGALSDELLPATFDPDVQLELPGLPGSAGTFRGYEGLRRADRELNEAIGASVATFREGKLARWRDYTDRAEALEAVGLRE